jgi:hypothetical protein
MYFIPLFLSSISPPPPFVLISLSICQCGVKDHHRRWIGANGEYDDTRCSLRSIGPPRPPPKLTTSVSPSDTSAHSTASTSHESAPITTTMKATSSGYVRNRDRHAVAAAKRASISASRIAAIEAVVNASVASKQNAASAEVDYHWMASYQAGEQIAPLGLPQGSVGTPSHVIRDNASQLPPHVLGRLGIGVANTALTMKLAPFRFDYHDMQRQRQQKRRQRRNDGTSTSTIMDNRAYDDDDKIRAYAAEDAEVDDDEGEEWDRHDALHHGEYDEGRGLARVDDETLYEQGVENPWDKGDASGLVMYTDANYWDDQKGEFDERTVDDLDISDDDGPYANDRAEVTAAKADGTYYDNNDNELDNDTKKASSKSSSTLANDSGNARARANKKTRRSAARAAARAALGSALPLPTTTTPLNSKATNSTITSSASSTISTATKVAERVMTSSGWRHGTGLGRRSQGRALPIAIELATTLAARNAMTGLPHGIGYIPPQRRVQQPGNRASFREKTQARQSQSSNKRRPSYHNHDNGSKRSRYQSDNNNDDVVSNDGSGNDDVITIGSIFDRPSTHPHTARQALAAAIDPQRTRRLADRRIGSFTIADLQSASND